MLFYSLRKKVHRQWNKNEIILVKSLGLGYTFQFFSNCLAFLGVLLLTRKNNTIVLKGRENISILDIGSDFEEGVISDC
jgi:hypothetical protein